MELRSLRAAAAARVVSELAATDEGKQVRAVLGLPLSLGFLGFRAAGLPLGLGFLGLGPIQAGKDLCHGMDLCGSEILSI
jgi:hypothetical protein